MIHESEHETHVQLETLRACERGVGAAPGESPDTWAWADPPHGADELAALDAPVAPDTGSVLDVAAVPDTPEDIEPLDRGMLAYARSLALTLGGAALAEDYALMQPDELEAVIARLEAALRATPDRIASASDGNQVLATGPDGAVAFVGGAAWLPTKAAHAWYEIQSWLHPAPPALPLPAETPQVGQLDKAAERSVSSLFAPIREVEPVDAAARREYYTLRAAAAKAQRCGKASQALRRPAEHLLRRGEVREVQRAVSRPRSQAPPVGVPW